MSQLINKNLMTINAKQISESNPDILMLNGKIINHIRQIEGKIRDAKKNKFSGIKYSALDRHFPVSEGMGNKKAQIYVYSTIIEQLKLNGFETKFTINDKEVSILISWPVEIDDNDYRRRAEVIKEAFADSDSL
jgi:hypothetical protein